MTWLQRLRSDPDFARRALLVVLAIGFIVRLWNLTAPIADRHSWNQVSAATVIRHFVEEGIDPLHPQWDVLEGADTGPRVEAEEAPLYHVAAALLARFFGPYEALARLLSIAASLLGAWWLYRLVRRNADEAAGVFAAFFFLISPFGWFYGRAIMSDMWMVAMLVAAVERYDAWLRTGSTRTLLTAALAVMLAGLFKPFALHVGLALLVLQIARGGWKSLIDWRLTVFAVVAVGPPLLWVWHAAGVGTLGNVTEGGNPLTAEHLWGPISLLWSGAFWFKLQARVFDQMATPVVALLAGIALVWPASRRRCGVAAAWLLAAFAYLLLVRDGNRMHDYYQLPFLPVFAALAGIGLGELAGRLDRRFVALILIAFAAWSTLYVRSAFRLDLSSHRAGQLVREVSRHDDLILVIDPGVTRKNQAIYAAHRRGWHDRSLKPDTLRTYIDRGARWLVLCVEDEQQAAHPEWGGLLQALPRVAHDRGPYGKRGRMHTIEVYALAGVSRL
ncbi:MAG: glycosyltransferase family 39 protein [Candidatus Lernaella stagnicola]|nr:glycosyltransferase family 39 protein [Candidatus Lernaella stagnicola]